ncbi:MAG: alpha/beta fold hydrolase [Dehalococcoidia bacterium]
MRWQGEEDVLVPPAMGRHMAARIPNCEAMFFPGEGHLLMIDHIAKIAASFAD